MIVRRMLVVTALVMATVTAVPALAPASAAANSSAFKDVPAGHVFGTEIDWLVAEGITTGFADSTFREPVKFSV